MQNSNAVAAQGRVMKYVAGRPSGDWPLRYAALEADIQRRSAVSSAVRRDITAQRIPPWPSLASGLTENQTASSG
jgi:hypothetical protein